MDTMISVISDTREYRETKHIQSAQYLNAFASSSFNKLTGYTVTGKQNIEGGTVSNFPERSVSEGVWFNVISLTRGWVGVELRNT